MTNPAGGETLAMVANLDAADARAAIEAAARAMPAWAARTAKDRAGVLRKWFELIMAAQEDLARLMTAEQGKPLAETRGEVAYGASFIEWFAEEGKRLYGDVIPSHHPAKRILVIRQPIGVVGAITPWNFPNAMVTRKCAPVPRGRLLVRPQTPPGDAPIGFGVWPSWRPGPASQRGCSTSFPRGARRLWDWASPSTPQCANSPSPARPRWASS